MVRVRKTPCDVYIIWQESCYVGVLHNPLLISFFLRCIFHLVVLSSIVGQLCKYNGTSVLQ